MCKKCEPELTRISIMYKGYMITGKKWWSHEIDNWTEEWKTLTSTCYSLSVAKEIIKEEIKRKKKKQLKVK